LAVQDPLTTTNRDQRRWSLTANALKAGIEQARRITLAMAVVGAILETWGAQIHQSNMGLAEGFGYAGAAVLGVAAVIRQVMLGHGRTQAWILARAGSESLKREMYLFRASAGPYASGNPALTILIRRDEILAKLQACQKYRVEPIAELAALGPLSAEEYLENRITGKTGQINYFKDRAYQYSHAQSRLNGGEFVLAVIAALLGAALTMTGKQAYGAWVAVITTISGAIAAHILSQHYEQLTISFRVTADRLESTRDRWIANGASGLADLVESCEAVLFAENQGWIAGADETAVPSRFCRIVFSLANIVPSVSEGIFTGGDTELWSTLGPPNLTVVPAGRPQRSVSPRSL
jgi:hypothetical protein